MLIRRAFAEHDTIGNGLVAVYNCQEQTGTVVHDIYRERNGTSTTDIRYLTDTGEMRRAFEFLSTEYVDFTGQIEKTVGEIFEVGQPFSISGWLKPDSITGTNINFGSTPNITQRGFYISTEAAKLALTLVDSAGNIDVLTATADTCSSGTWLHYILTYGGGAIDTDWVFYTAGTSEPWTVTTSTGAVSNIASAAKNCYMGCTDSALHFAGSFEQLCIWNREITAPEASWLAEGHVADLSFPKKKFFSGNSSLNEDLVAHWALDDDAPNKHVADSLGRVPGVLVSPTHNSEDITIAGLQGGAVDFDGTDYINLQSAWDLINFNTDEPHSFFMVYKHTAVFADCYTLFSTRGTGSEIGIQFLIETGTGKLFPIIKSLSGGNIRCKSSGAIPLSTWLLLGYTYDGSGLSTGLTAYINTTAYTDRAGSSGSMNGSITTDVNILHDLRDPILFPASSNEMQQVSIWQKKLTTTDVVSLYDNGAILPC